MPQNNSDSGVEDRLPEGQARMVKFIVAPPDYKLVRPACRLSIQANQSSEVLMAAIQSDFLPDYHSYRASFVAETITNHIQL